MGRISTSLKKVTDITRPDLLPLGELGGGGIIRKTRINGVFVTYERVIGS